MYSAAFPYIQTCIKNSLPLKLSVVDREKALENPARSATAKWVYNRSSPSVTAFSHMSTVCLSFWLCVGLCRRWARALWRSPSSHRLHVLSAPHRCGRARQRRLCASARTWLCTHTHIQTDFLSDTLIADIYVCALLMCLVCMFVCRLRRREAALRRQRAPAFPTWVCTQLPFYLCLFIKVSYLFKSRIWKSLLL